MIKGFDLSRVSVSTVFVEEEAVLGALQTSFVRCDSDLAREEVAREIRKNGGAGFLNLMAAHPDSKIARAAQAALR